MKLSQPAFAANTSITYVKNVKKKKKEEEEQKKHTNNKETKQKQKINKRSQG